MTSLINCKLLILISIFIIINSVYDSANSESNALQPIQIGHKIIQVEIADTKEKRKHGLMHREYLPEDQGMLFVYPSEKILLFWMKDTYIPLSIGFFNVEGELLEIQEMRPDNGVLTVDSERKMHTSSQPCKYALEMNEGWFSKNGISIGAKLKID